MFLTQKAFAIAKIEVASYTPVEGVAVDFDIEIENLEWSPEVAEFQRKLADGLLDTFNSVMGKQSCTVSFSSVLNPGATAATLPKWDKFLLACGYKKTIHTTTGISWVIHSDNTHVPITLTCHEIDDGASPATLVTTVGGAMGNVEFMIGDVGEPIQIVFEFKGSLEDVTVGAVIVPTGVSTVQPSAFLGATVTIGGLDQCISKFSFDTGNSIQLQTCPDELTGIRGAYVGSRETTLTIDPLGVLEATEDVYADWKNGVTGAVVVSLASTPALKISAPVAQKSTVARGERDEAVSSEQVFRLHKLLGNDVLEILQGSKT